MNKMMQMDKSTMGMGSKAMMPAGMGSMMSMMMSKMMGEVMGDTLDLTMGNGNQSLFIEHTQGFLKYKEGSQKYTQNYFLCCVSGMSHKPEFEIGAQVAFIEQSQKIMQ